jgi:hypothetical protein
VLAGVAWSVSAQQPFFTDDADVTPKRKFHFELSNQYSFLPTSAFPNRQQNALVYQLNYGLLDGLELGVDSPHIVIVNARDTVHPRVPFGIGDTNLTLKWNFRRESQDSKWPALTIAYAVELPTGDTRTQLGSGITDHRLVAVAQKQLRGRTTLRVNQGVLFTGNNLTGVVGLRSQGVVYLSSASLTRQFAPRLSLGVEVNGAVAERGLQRGAWQQQVGGKYRVQDKLTFDFGGIVGQFGESPRFGLQIGLSVDF